MVVPAYISISVGPPLLSACTESLNCLLDPAQAPVQVVATTAGSPNYPQNRSGHLPSHCAQAPAARLVLQLGLGPGLGLGPCHLQPTWSAGPTLPPSSVSVAVAAAELARPAAAAAVASAAPAAAAVVLARPAAGAVGTAYSVHQKHCPVLGLTFLLSLYPFYNLFNFCLLICPVYFISFSFFTGPKPNCLLTTQQCGHIPTNSRTSIVAEMSTAPNSLAKAIPFGSAHGPPALGRTKMLIQPQRQIPLFGEHVCFPNMVYVSPTTITAYVTITHARTHLSSYRSVLYSMG